MWLVPIVLAVVLSPPFAEATITAVPSTNGIEANVTVELNASSPPGYVVMHVLLPEDQETYSLAAAGDGTYVATVELAAADRAVLFEAGWDSGAYSLSEVTSLVSLGVPAELVGESFDLETLDDGGNKWWAWLAAGTGGAAVAAFILFFFLPRAPDTAAGEREL